MTDAFEKYYRKILSEKEYHVLREKGTEEPFSGQYHDFFERGVYLCKVCKSPLFSSESKFPSKCGWPSFTNTIDDSATISKEDTSHNMQREEVLCSNCHSHLGHVFNDGPKPLHTRYCINSICLIFQPARKGS